jgi:hypothetical protein
VTRFALAAIAAGWALLVMLSYIIVGVTLITEGRAEYFAMSWVLWLVVGGTPFFTYNSIRGK